MDIFFYWIINEHTLFIYKVFLFFWNLPISQDNEIFKMLTFVCNKILIKYSFYCHHYHIICWCALMILKIKWVPSIRRFISCSQCATNERNPKSSYDSLMRLWIWLFYTRLYLKKHLRFSCVFEKNFVFILLFAQFAQIHCVLYVVRMVVIGKQFEMTKEKGKS